MERVGLKSKMYSMIYEEDGKLTEQKTAKGIKKNVIKHHTKHDHYKECLFDKTTFVFHEPDQIVLYSPMTIG
jgi:hypothetical protein